MRNKKHILTLLLITITWTRSFSQCNWQWHDSIRNINDWDSIKYEFIPKDISQYILIFEELNEEQHIRNEALVKFNYYASTDTIEETNCFHSNGNSCIMHDDEKIHKRFQKFYDGEFIITNIDSIDTLPIEKYPYVLMFYTEVITTELNKKLNMLMPIISRNGYYIWDRRNDYKYPVYMCLGKKEDKLFFSKLNK